MKQVMIITILHIEKKTNFDWCLFLKFNNVTAYTLQIKIWNISKVKCLLSKDVNKQVLKRNTSF